MGARARGKGVRVGDGLCGAFVWALAHGRMDGLQTGRIKLAWACARVCECGQIGGSPRMQCAHYLAAEVTTFCQAGTRPPWGKRKGRSGGEALKSRETACPMTRIAI